MPSFTRRESRRPSMSLQRNASTHDPRQARPRLLRSSATEPSVTASSAVRGSLASPKPSQKATDILNRVAVGSPTHSDYTLAAAARSTQICPLPVARKEYGKLESEVNSLLDGCPPSAGTCNNDKSNQYLVLTIDLKKMATSASLTLTTGAHLNIVPRMTDSPQPPRVTGSSTPVVKYWKDRKGEQVMKRNHQATRSLEFRRNAIIINESLTPGTNAWWRPDVSTVKFRLGTSDQRLHRNTNTIPKRKSMPCIQRTGRKGWSKARVMS